MARKKRAPRKRVVYTPTNGYVAKGQQQAAMRQSMAMQKTSIWIGLIMSVIGIASTLFYGSSYFNNMTFVNAIPQFAWVIVSIIGIVLTYISYRKA